MSLPHNQPPEALPLRSIGPMAGNGTLPLAPPEIRDDAPC